MVAVGVCACDGRTWDERTGRGRQRVKVSFVEQSNPALDSPGERPR